MVPAITETLPTVVSLTTPTVSPSIQLSALPVNSKAPPLSTRRPRKRKRRCTVSFASSQQVKLVERVAPPNVTWYSAQEYDNLEHEVRTTIRAMRQDTRLSSDVCTRGLEKYRTCAIHEMKKRMERIHVSAILQEQDRQHLGGVRNARALRTLSKQHSKWSVLVALELAKRDAMEAGYKVETETNDCKTDCTNC